MDEDTFETLSRVANGEPTQGDHHAAERGAAARPPPWRPPLCWTSPAPSPK